MSGYITPNKALAHLDRLAAWQAGERPAPVTVEFDLSNRCSLGCQSCHFAHTHSRGPWANRQRDVPEAFSPGGDLADPRMVKRALRQMAEAGVRGVVWSGGGEPTLHPDITGIMRTAHEVGLEQGMYTLGGHLSTIGETVGRLATWVVVSLDCLDEETYRREKGVGAGRFEAACEGVRTLAGAETATVGVSFLIHSENAWQLESMMELGRELGAGYVMFRPTIETAPSDPATCLDDRSWIGEDWLAFAESFVAEPGVEIDVDRFRQYRDWQGREYATCYGVRLNATITPDGRVWLCPQRRGVEGSCVGDLSQESFADLWQRHPGEWTDFSGCRAMCRLHLMNQTLDQVYAPRKHEAFV